MPGSRAIFFFLPAALLAQMNTAELTGVVLDQSGGVVRHVNLTLVNPATCGTRSTQTDAQGGYRFVRMPPGSYDLTAVLDGFRTEKVKGITLTVGQQATFHITLAVDSVASEAVVTAGAALVDLQSAALSDAIDPRAVRELPLNGRDFAQLALLEPGVAPSRRSSDSGGPGTKLVINGNRPSRVSFVLDGSDINDANNNTPGSAAGVLLGVDTLVEFRVNTNSYSAAYGRSAGGVISAVTKSGTNELHGSIFEFVRNSSFDAKNFFDSPTAPIPPFRRNQFGVEVDGPIVRNKTFFLGSYEGPRQRLGVTSRSVVPDADARLGIFPNGSRVTVNLAVPQYLVLVPLPNDRNFGDGTGEFVNAASQATNEDFFVGRVDHRFSERTTLFARFTIDDATVAVPDAIRLVEAQTKSSYRYLTVEMTRILTPQLLSTVRGSMNRSNTESANNYLRELDPALSFFPGRPLGQISVTGFFSLGPSRFGPSYRQSLYQFSDDLSWIRGRHSLKFGVDHRFYRLPTSRPQSPYGFYQFNGLTDFLQARPASVELTLPDSELDRNWRQSMTGVYVQDDIRLHQRLTLNLGVRYERVSVPKEANGLSANFLNPLTDRTTTVGPMFSNPSNRNFAPRAGFAWDPFGSGETSVRGGFGIFYDPVWADFYANAGNRLAPFYVLGSIRNPVFPRAETLVGSPGFVLGRQDVLVSNPNNPYTMQYNFTIQRQLAESTAVTVSYAGQRGVHLVRFIDGNQAIPQVLSDGRKFFPENSTTRNPNLTGVRYKVTDGQSVYNAMQASIQHRMRGGILFRLNYTFAKNIDDGSVTATQGGDNDLPQDPDSRKAERGLSNYDVRHYFSAFWNWDLPAVPGLPKWLGSRWQWNTIATAASGNPFSVVVGFDRARARFQAGTSPQRPDLVTERSTNPVLGGPDRYFDPSAFSLPAAGFYGNLGRNTLVGPGLAMVDMSINKRFRVTERVTAQFRTAMFNSLNRPNLAIPSARTIFTSSGPVGSAGRITSTLTSARQLQLGMKLVF